MLAGLEPASSLYKSRLPTGVKHLIVLQEAQRPSTTSIFIPRYLMCLLAPQTGLEPVTYCLEGSCSIQLSY